MEKRTVTIHRNVIESSLMLIKEFVKAHRKSAAIGAAAVLAAVVLFIGGAVYYDISSSSDLRAYESLTRDYEAGPKDAGAFSATVTKLVSITDKSHFGYVHANGYYLAAGMYFERKMYEEAKTNYLKFVDRSSSSVFAPLALFQAAVCAENTDKVDEALSLYKRIEKSYKDSAFTDRLFYDLGRMYQKKGEKVTAKEYFGKVIAQYPNSLFAVQAKMRTFLLGL
jgi:tetratricopeptide (TPR) repeat protein